MTPPVLFLIFNRPAQTKTVFEAIRRARPKRLFVAADGPRANRSDENQLCENTREIITEVDWDCDLNTLFRSQNLGCCAAVQGAISWFFTHVESGIILEDDCLPEQTFFPYCNDMLSRLANQPEVLAVTGNNFQNGIRRGKADYYFSRYFHCWGWATWRDRWARYQTDVDEDAINEGLQYFNGTSAEQQYWRKQFDLVHSGQVDTWDYRWLLSIWRASGLVATPQVNMVSNIGGGEDATHTKALAPMPRFPLHVTDHPDVIEAARIADAYVSNTHYNITHSAVSTKRWSTFLQRLRGFFPK